VAGRGSAPVRADGIGRTRPPAGIFRPNRHTGGRAGARHSRYSRQGRHL